MTIGVIVTVYNLERYVAEALTSVLNQTLKPDRIIVINDASTDNSLPIIKQFAPHVEIVNHTQNEGVLPSVIEAVKMLTTDVVALLDGDDVWEVDKLAEIQSAFLANATNMMVLHNYIRVNSSGELLPGLDITQKNLLRIIQYPVHEHDELLKESILSYRGVWLGSALSFKRSLLNVDLFEQWSLKIWGHELSHQDQPLAAYLINNNPNDRIRYLHRELFRYRIYGENSSGNSTTLPKALRTLQRSKATLMRTHAMVKQIDYRFQSLQRQEMKLKEIMYLEALYQKQWFTAFKLFFSLFCRFWNRMDQVKEISRFGGVLMLGPTRFLKLK